MHLPLQEGNFHSLLAAPSHAWVKEEGNAAHYISLDIYIGQKEAATEKKKKNNNKKKKKKKKKKIYKKKQGGDAETSVQLRSAPVLQKQGMPQLKNVALRFGRARFTNLHS